MKTAATCLMSTALSVMLFYGISAYSEQGGYTYQIAQGSYLTSYVATIQSAEAYPLKCGVHYVATDHLGKPEEKTVYMHVPAKQKDQQYVTVTKTFRGYAAFSAQVYCQQMTLRSAQ